MSDEWAAFAVSLPREEEMDVICHREYKSVLSVETRLRIINSTLPGYRDMKDSKKLEITMGYCQYLEHCLVENFEWEQQKRKEIELLKAGESEKKGTTTITEPPLLKAETTPIQIQKDEPAVSTTLVAANADNGGVDGAAPEAPPLPASPRPPPPIPQRPTFRAPPFAQQSIALDNVSDCENTSPSSASANNGSISSANIRKSLESIPSSPTTNGSISSRQPTTHKKSVDQIQAVQLPQVELPEPGQQSSTDQGNQVEIRTTCGTPNHSSDPAPRKRDICGSLDTYISAFLDVVDFFTRVYQEQLPTSVSEFSALNPEFEVIFVFRMLSFWTCIQRFNKPTFVSMGSEPAVNLVDLSETLPRLTDFADSKDPLSEHRLHTFGMAFSGDGLVSLGDVELVRTWDICCHLYFDKANLKLYIFATPGFCYSQNHGTENFHSDVIQPWRTHNKGLRETPSITGIPVNYTQEISRTMDLLFDKNPKSRKVFRDFQKGFEDLRQLIPSMRVRSRQIGAVWTEEGKHSVVSRQRNAPIRALVSKGYHLEDFPYFAERLLILEHYLHEVKPSSFRQLLQDSRDQMQYYTFIVAFIVFVLTVLGLILAILQTVASFMQVNLALKQSG